MPFPGSYRLQPSWSHGHAFPLHAAATVRFFLVPTTTASRPLTMSLRDSWHAARTIVLLELGRLGAHQAWVRQYENLSDVCCIIHLGDLPANRVRAFGSIVATVRRWGDGCLAYGVSLARVRSILVATGCTDQPPDWVNASPCTRVAVLDQRRCRGEKRNLAEIPATVSAA